MDTAENRIFNDVNYSVVVDYQSKLIGEIINIEHSNYKNIYKKSIYIYDSLFVKKTITLDNLFFYKRMIPGFGTLDQWSGKDEKNSDCIACEIINYDCANYLTTKINSDRSYFLASNSPEPFEPSSEILDNTIKKTAFEWATKQKEIVQLQKDYNMEKRGIWWKDPETEISHELYQLNDRQYFGFIDFDPPSLGDGRNQNNYPYLYFIENGNINGIFLGKIFFPNDQYMDERMVKTNCISAFQNKANSNYYFIIQNGFADTLFLIEGKMGKWRLIETAVEGYFDCPD